MQPRSLPREEGKVLIAEPVGHVARRVAGELEHRLGHNMLGAIKVLLAWLGSMSGGIGLDACFMQVNLHGVMWIAGERRDSMNPLHILLIDLNHPCPTEDCTRLAEMMQRFPSGGDTRLQTTTLFPPPLHASPPDLILLRLSLDQPPVAALGALRRDWDKTPVLGLFCLGWAKPCRGYHTLLTGLEDFVSCPFTEIDLFLRLQRLLHGKNGEGPAVPMRPARPRCTSCSW
jgi:hypothetical protein